MELNFITLLKLLNCPKFPWIPIFSARFSLHGLYGARLRIIVPLATRDTTSLALVAR
jgi:hypothetical protein